MTPKGRNLVAACSVCLLLLFVEGKYAPAAKKSAFAVEPAAEEQTEDSGRKPGELVNARDRLELDPAKLVSTRAVALSGEIFQSHAFSNLGARMAASRVIYDVILSQKSGGIVGTVVTNLLWGGTVVEASEKGVVLASGNVEIFEKGVGHVAGHSAGVALEHGLKVFGLALNIADLGWNSFNFGYRLYEYYKERTQYSFCEMASGGAKVVLSGVGVALAAAATAATGGLALAAGSLGVAVTGMAMEKFEESIQDTCMGSQVKMENTTNVMELQKLNKKLKEMGEGDKEKEHTREEAQDVREKVHGLMRRVSFRGDEADFLEWYLAGHKEFMKRTVEAVMRGNEPIELKKKDEDCTTPPATECRKITGELLMQSPKLFEELFTEHVKVSLDRSQQEKIGGLTSQHREELHRTREVVGYIKANFWKPLWVAYFLRNDFSELPEEMRRSTDQQSMLITSRGLTRQLLEHKKAVLYRVYNTITSTRYEVEENRMSWWQETQEQIMERCREKNEQKRDDVQNQLEAIMAEDSVEVKHIQANFEKNREIRKRAREQDLSKTLRSMQNLVDAAREENEQFYWTKDAEGIKRCVTTTGLCEAVTASGDPAAITRTEAADEFRRKYSENIAIIETEQNKIEEILIDIRLAASRPSQPVADPSATEKPVQMPRPDPIEQLAKTYALDYNAGKWTTMNEGAKTEFRKMAMEYLDATQPSKPVDAKKFWQQQNVGWENGGAELEELAKGYAQEYADSNEDWDTMEEQAKKRFREMAASEKGPEAKKRFREDFIKKLASEQEAKKRFREDAIKKLTSKHAIEKLAKKYALDHNVTWTEMNDKAKEEYRKYAIEKLTGLS